MQYLVVLSLHLTDRLYLLLLQGRYVNTSTTALTSPKRPQSKNKLSEWTKNVQEHLITPEKSDSMDISPHDSGKKKKSKFVRYVLVQLSSRKSCSYRH